MQGAAKEEQINKASENILVTERVSKLLIKFAVPSIIAMIVNALYNIVDQIFIGNKIGYLGNAATNITFPLTTISLAISLLLGQGGAAKQNLELGANNREKAEKTVGTVISLVTVVSVVLFLSELLFLPHILKFFGATDNNFEAAYKYSKIIIFGLPFVTFSTAVNNTIRADGSPTYSMVSMILGAVINTILDPLFLFVFDMGIEGAAYATVIGQFAGFIVSLIYIPRFKNIKLKKRHFKISFSLAKTVFVLGIASFCNQLAITVVQIVLNNSMTFYGELSVYGGDIPLACSGIMTKVNMIFMAVVIGIGQGSQPIVSFNYGAGRYDRVKETYVTAAKYATVVSIFCFFLFQIFPDKIISIFGSGSPEYYEFAKKCFRIYLFATFINGLQPVTTVFFTAIGKGIKGMFIALTRQIIFLLPFILIFPLFFGIDGILYAAPVADIGAAITAILFVKKEFKIMDRSTF